MLSATSDGESKHRPTLLEHSLYIRHDAKPWMAHFTHEESELWSWHFGLGLSPLPTANFLLPDHLYLLFHKVKCSNDLASKQKQISYTLLNSSGATVKISVTNFLVHCYHS